MKRRIVSLLVVALFLVGIAPAYAADVSAEPFICATDATAVSRAVTPGTVSIRMIVADSTNNIYYYYPMGDMCDIS